MNAMLQNTQPDAADARGDALFAACEHILSLCRRDGADQCEVRVDTRDGLEAGVRNGDVETLTRKRDEHLSVTAYVRGRKGTATTGDLSPASLRSVAEKACAIARQTEPDPCHGLADPALHARYFPDLDQWHPWALDATGAIELALQTEDAGLRHDARVGQSNGASVETGGGHTVYANSRGFLGAHRATRHHVSAAFIARDEAGLQGGGWYDVACHPGDLQSPADIGRRAAERTLARLGARRLPTQQCPVLFAPEVASSLFGHLASALDGGAVYRGSSFLAGKLGERWLPDCVDVTEAPHTARSLGGRVFDDEGVATLAAPLVAAGHLHRYVLDSYAARRLGLASTGNAGGVSHVEVTGTAHSQDDILMGMGTGLLVTNVMGQGVSLVTGDYSRGASGFWVDHGRIAYPVDEITIASNLREIFGGILAIGTDRDRRQRIACGSVLVERMTVAGR